MALMNYAGVLRLNGALDESLALFERAETLFAETLGTDSMEYLTALNNAALCHQDRGAFETALARHLRVCSALERLDDATVAYATSLYNTGFCCKRWAKPTWANLIRRSIEVYRQLLPEYHELIEHAKPPSRRRAARIMNGMALGAAFFETQGLPALRARHEEALPFLAAGLVGEGSNASGWTTRCRATTIGGRASASG